ncbi:MAG: hypothetical protein ACREOE_13425 [Gemmatimonadales bacterium]
MTGRGAADPSIDRFDQARAFARPARSRSSKEFGDNIMIAIDSAKK